MTEEQNGGPTKTAGETDISVRVESFNKELAPLLGKYELGLAAIAFLELDGRIGAKATLVSTRSTKVAPSQIVQP